MNCDKARRRISETLDGASQDAALSGHLESCAACSRVLARSRSLNAALASLPQLRPSAAFSSGVLASLAMERRQAAAPVWPLAAALAISSTALAAGAMSLTISIPQIAAQAARLAAVLQWAGHLALQALPAPRAGAELSAAMVMAVALFLTISMPHAHKTRLNGAKS